jgi:hypothetical protein
MCKFRSGEAVFVDECEVRLYTTPEEDSHTKNRENHGIAEAQPFGLREGRHTPVEYTPKRAKTLDDFDGYELAFDAGKPEWWTDSHTASVTRQFQADIRAWLSSGGTSWAGDMDLRGSAVTELPALASVGGDMWLRGSAVTELPALASVRGDMDLRGSKIKELPALASVGGDMWLRGSEIIVPDGIVKGYIYR